MYPLKVARDVFYLLMFLFLLGILSGVLLRAYGY